MGANCGSERRPIGYVPIYEPEPGRLSTAALVFCSNCGACISGSGGPKAGAPCTACCGPLVPEGGKAMEFIAHNQEGWWTIQTFTGPRERFYAIRKETGEVMELPDSRAPFVVFPQVAAPEKPPA